MARQKDGAAVRHEADGALCRGSLLRVLTVVRVKLGLCRAPKPSTTATSAAWSPSYLNGRPPDAPPPEYPITSQIEGELRELRVRFANTRFRLLYQRSDLLVVLLHAIEKDTGEVPRRDIALAKRRMTDFKRRMDAERRRPPRAAARDAPPKRRSWN